MSNDLNKFLEKSISFSKETRIQKIKKNPKIFMSKILEILALWFKIPIKVKAKTFWGENMTVIIPEVVSSCLYRYSFFEEGLTKMILEYLKPGMTFFDIGAHFGYFTLMASYIVGGSGRVYSFEPIPRTFNILKANVSNRRNVVLNNCAVYSIPKKITINDYGTRYSAFNSVYNARLPQNVISKLKPLPYEVSAISVDEYVINNNIKPNFIKIDAESSEYEIILGMEKTIDKFRPIISIEVGDMKGVPPSKDLVNFLVSCGNYQPYEFKEGKILQHALKNEQYQYDNILFLPGE